MSILLSAERPANFYSSVYSASQPNHSSKSSKGKKSCEDTVPKRDKGLPSSSCLPQSLFTSEAPGLFVALKLFLSDSFQIQLAAFVPVI